MNATTQGLPLTSKLIAAYNEAGLSKALTRIIDRSDKPLIRKGMDMAMCLMGEQFIVGEIIFETLASVCRFKVGGSRYSYDILGEATIAEEDAQRYLVSYEQAIHAIGQASGGHGIYEGSGISIELSALYPRYSRTRYDRTASELYLRMKAPAIPARGYDIGINIDAEEADHLELSLDLLECLCFAPELAGWNDAGPMVQGHRKHCPFVLSYIADLTCRSKRRLMIRLVKGTYWDNEIKRTRIDGLEGYPICTRKICTDVSYLAYARKLLTAPRTIFPRLATHSTHMPMAVYYMVDQNYHPGRCEFRCPCSMGEPLYEQVVGNKPDKLNRPYRIYAPVGTHETLLVCLVRRLLENGADTSFVNHIADESIPSNDLIAGPMVVAEKMYAGKGTFDLPYPEIPLLRALCGNTHTSSSGIDPANEQRLASLSSVLPADTSIIWTAEPTIGDASYVGDPSQLRRPVHSLSDLCGMVGHVTEATEADVDIVLSAAAAAAPV